MLVSYHEAYMLPLPADHRFPMRKYPMLREQLLRDQIIHEKNLHKPEPATDESIRMVHDIDFWQRATGLALSRQEVRALGFPLTAQLVLRERLIIQGTIDAALHARDWGVALNIAGGTHHAFACRGEGFCLFNDIAIAAQYLLNKRLAEQVLIVDLDVHQGNGTAAIFSSESRVFTFSMHGAHNYPFRKEVSDCDIALPNGIGGDQYLSLLSEALGKVLDAVRPDFVFYLSGVDVLDSDQFGKMSLTMEDCLLRDELVFGYALRYGVPVAVAMGGGYSADISRIVAAHCQTFRAARVLHMD